MRILIAYFSRTGGTERVAQRIAQSYSGEQVEIRRIRPCKERSYLAWLVLSCVPGSKVAIQPLDCDLDDYDLIVMGSPKWTLSCPPFNEFLGKLQNQRGKSVVYFMTYGGFDQDRYAKRVISKLTEMGCHVVDSMLVKRRAIETGEY